MHPAKHRAFMYQRSDGFRVVGSGTPSSVELIVGNYCVPLNYGAARALTVFLLRWWVINAWCGLRRRIHAWQLARALDRQIRG